MLIFAWSLIVYGFGAQWMRFAYFGVYHLERFDEYVASLMRLLAAGMAIVAWCWPGSAVRGVRAELSGRGLCFGLRHNPL